VIGRGLLKRPTGLARDPARGRIYVADTYAHDIKVFSDGGELLDVIGGRGEGEGEFNYPTHLAFANDELYVTDTMNNRIQVLAADGGRRRLGQRGLYIGNLVRPKGVSVDSEGNVYVVESYFDSLLIFAPNGDFLMPIGGTGTATGRFYLPSGVWVDAKNRVHVADMFNGRIVLFQFLGGG
jgi:DNA-binding beta-propeller fold protein YncE